MKSSHFRIIHRNDVPLGGFAGIVETRMVMSPAVWPEASSNSGISRGLKGFIYMAIGHIKPNDGAPMHSHRDVDIVTLISSGEMGHEGTNGGGTVIQSPGVQVQRSGKGMMHSEFSTQPEKADFVQLWFLPPKKGLEPGYQNIDLTKGGGLKTVLGGNSGDCFDNNIWCRIGLPVQGEKISSSEPCIAIVFQGSAKVNNHSVAYGDLVEASSLEIIAGEKLGLVLITSTSDITEG